VGCLNQALSKTNLLLLTAAILLAAGLFGTGLAAITGHSDNSHVKDNNYSLDTLIASGLTDHRGREVTTAQLKDKLVLVNFFFTSCAAACPVQTSVIREVKNTIDESVDIIFLSVSIAPINDSQSAIESYVNKFGVNLSDWRFVTASVKDTERLIERFAVTINSVEVSEEQSSVEQMSAHQMSEDHRNTGYLYAKNGRLMQQYQLVPTVTNRLVREITQLSQLEARELL